MGLRPGSQSPDCLVKSHIGSAYDNVKTVADNIEDVNSVANNLDNITVVGNSAPYMQTIADNIDDVVDVSTNMDDVILVADNMPFIRNNVFNFVQENIPMNLDMPLGSRWYKPSTNQVFAYYFSDVNPVGIWTETTNGY